MKKNEITIKITVDTYKMLLEIKKNTNVPMRHIVTQAIKLLKKGGKYKFNNIFIGKEK